MKAVVVLTTNSSGQVLFGKRSDRDEWSTVAGHLRDKEDPEEGAKRLLKEQIQQDGSVVQTETRSIGDTELYVFTAKIQGEPAPGEHFTEFKWVSPSEDAPDGSESWSRHAFQDTFTKSEDTMNRAVVVLAVNPENRLLFGKRRDNERWSTIAGHLKEGEDPAHGAVRELYEEARLIPQSLLSLGERDVDGCCVHIYKARVDGNPSNEHDPDKEFSEMEWVDITHGIPKDMELHGPKDKDENAATSVFGLEKSEMDDLVKKISELKPGNAVALPTQQTAVNYSHLLSPELQGEGYRLRAVHTPRVADPEAMKPDFKAEIFHLPTSKDKPVGRVSGYLGKGKEKGVLQPHSELHEKHRGKGLGVNMYEALYNLAQQRGVTHIGGWYHSDDAKRVHESLARKHKMRYKAERDRLSDKLADSYPNAPYKYKIS